MALEITEEQATELGLSPEQVTKVTGLVNPWYDSQLAEEKKAWDTKANTDAQGILDGALKLVVDTTKVPRNEGEKAGEYIPRAWGEYSKAGQTELETLKADYNKKLEEFDGDAGTKEALKEAERKLDEAQKKYANYDDLTGYKDKYETLLPEHMSLKNQVCYGGVKPNFPDTVNPFEADHKWKAFVAATNKEWDVELVDGVETAINKENKHKTMPLVDLVKKDEDLTKLMEGRQQTGTKGKEADLTVITDVPFKVPANADSAARAKLIKDYLTEQGINPMSDTYATKFAELNSKIRQGLQK